MRMPRTLHLFIASLLASALLCSAADRALVIGVGVYSDVRPNLPGIDHDVKQEVAALERLGFKPGDIHTLADSQATLARIRAEIRNWLAKGTGPNDRVVFYFSGHGSISLDDKGKEEAVLVPYDTKIGNGRLLNALGGPELGADLSAIGTRNVLIVADACHSGHMTDATKGFGIVPKFLQYPGMPAGEKLFAVEGKGLDRDNRMNHILLAACRRDETAGATSTGSILTVALDAAVEQLLAEKKPVTMNSAHAQVVARLGNSAEQHPELSGDADLKDFDWAGHQGPPPAPIHDDPPPAPVSTTEWWGSLRTFFEGRSGDVAVRLSKQRYRNTEHMTIDLDIPGDGYLNIVAIGDHDSEPTVLYPNKYAPDNHVSAGRLTLPNSTKFFFSQETDVADEKDELIVLFSTTPVNMYNDGSGKEVFRKLDKNFRSTVVREGDGGNTSGYKAGFAYYEITK